MSHRFVPIVLHRNEWERLKKQGGPIEPGERVVDSREEYFNALSGQSQKWINRWPDSIKDIKERQEKQRQKQRKEDKALVDAFRKSRKHENSQKASDKAKQIIFDDSCYGRQLISAIIESRTIDEREAQIALQKEIKQKEADLEKDNVYVDCPFVSNMDHKEAVRKLAALECVKVNQEIELMKKDKAAKLKAEKNQCESVNDDMVQQVRDAEAKKKAEIKCIEKQEIEEFEAKRKEIQKHRKISEDLDNALIEVNKKEQDRIQCKVAAVLKKVIEETRHGERAVKCYDMVDELQQSEKKRYEDFIGKGIEIHEERNAILEAKKNELENRKRAERRQLSEENKVAKENYKLHLKHTAPVNKCVCDIQTILLKPASKPPLDKVDEAAVKPDSEKGVENSDKVIKKLDSNEGKLSFLKPRNKLMKALKYRAQQPSGYSGAEGADKYFAQQANDALQRTNHKFFARKVVAEYLKVNCLDRSDLPISNY